MNDNLIFPCCYYYFFTLEITPAGECRKWYTFRCVISTWIIHPVYKRN